MSKNITIVGKVCYKDKTPIAKARIKIWETDALQKNNPDDLIVNDTTDSQGRFSGSGRWKDSGLVEVATFRYEVTYQGKVKAGGNITNPHQFFKELKTNWLSPAQVREENAKNSVTISGRVLYEDRSPIAGARVKIWETDSLQKNNPDDLIVNDISDQKGGFSGSGRWKDSGFVDVATYRYEVTYQGQVKAGGNITNPHQFFNEIRTDWSSSMTWTNWLGSYETSIPSDQYFQPKNDVALASILEMAVHKELKVKVVGAGHSHSKVAQPVADNMLVDLSQLSGRLPSYTWLKPKSDWGLQTVSHTLTRVKSGTTIRTLCQKILAPNQLGLINMGTFDGQTISGAVNTNTHGTGILLPGLADMVRSVEMYVIKAVSPRNHRVERWVIEPTDGISDPVQFKSKGGSAFLVQNDDIFHSVVCGYGLFGIVYSYTLEVRDLYWLNETFEATTWRDIKQKLDSQTSGMPNFLTETDQVKLYIHTAECIKEGQLNGNIHCRIDRWQEKPMEMKPAGWDAPQKIHKIWPPMRPRTTQNIGKDLSSLGFDINGPKNDGKPSSKTVSTVTSNFFEKTDIEHFLRGYKKSAYYRAIRRNRDNTLNYDSTLKNNRIDNTNADGDPETSDFATTVEICVPVSETSKTIELALNFIAQSGINFVTPTGVRFTRSSEHFLSPTYGATSTFIEISGWLPNTRKDQWTQFKEQYNRVFADMIGHLRKEIPNVRFHMGKYNTYGVKSLRSDYPRFDEWVNNYHLFNASRLFDCPNSEKWKLAQAKPNRSMVDAGKIMDGWKV